MAEFRRETVENLRFRAKLICAAHPSSAAEGRCLITLIDLPFQQVDARNPLVLLLRRRAHGPCQFIQQQVFEVITSYLSTTSLVA